jgi:hypothetical protein
VTDAVVNGTFATADASGEPGQAADWTRTAHQELPGWAAFRQPAGFLAVEERFAAHDAPARLTLTFPAPTQTIGVVASWPVAAVLVAPTNAIQFNNIDLHYALRPGVCFQVVGLAHHELDGYWTVVRSVLVGSDTVVYVTEDVLAMAVGARIYAAAAINVYAGAHAHPAAVVDTTAYPVAALAPGATIGVRVDRGDLQTIAFPGGETTARDVADALADLVVGGGARVVDGQVEIYSDTLGPGAYVQVEAGTAALTFPAVEERGWGQILQLWPEEFADPAAAPTAEVAAVMQARLQHVTAAARASATPDRVDLATTWAGSGATLAIDGLAGTIHDAAAWPVAIGGLDLDLWVLTVGAVTVTFDAGDTTPALVAERLQLALTAAGASVVATASADRVYLTCPTTLRCNGGAANAVLNFPTYTVQGGGPAIDAITLGGTGAGADDVGWFVDFDAVTSILGTFGAESSASDTAEAFTWTDVRGTFDHLDAVTGGFRSACDPVAPPAAATWTNDAEAFDDRWGNDWITTYAPFTPAPGAWVPPGVAPDARIVGRPLTFPLQVLATRALLAVHSETDQTWYTLAVTPGTYATAAALVVELEARRVASGMLDDVAFTATPDGAIALGWDGTVGGDGAIHLGTPRGAQAARDARATLGLHPLASDPGASGVPVPAGWYAGAPVASWDADDAYSVDAYSRVVFAAITDPATAEEIAAPNGALPGLFNALDGAIADSYSEAFAWVAITASGAYTGWPLATFSSGDPFEDFHGW